MDKQALRFAFLLRYIFILTSLPPSPLSPPLSAPGWLGYATAECPAGQTLTKMEGKWLVGATPKRSQSFYSPWFGIDASDNLNLLQPVNPWLGNQWVIYNEYFQWSPEHNQNSAQHVVKAGDQLYGAVTLDASKKSYAVFHNVSGSTTWDVTMDIPIQKGKTYTIAYVVYEKVAPCGDFPPDGKVTFTDVNVYCDDVLITPTWKTGFVEDVCNNRATIIDPHTVEITWNTKAADPPAHKIKESQRVKALGGSF